MKHFVKQCLLLTAQIVVIASIIGYQPDHAPALAQRPLNTVDTPPLTGTKELGGVGVPLGVSPAPESPVSAQTSAWLELTNVVMREHTLSADASLDQIHIYAQEIVEEIASEPFSIAVEELIKYVVAQKIGKGFLSALAGKLGGLFLGFFLEMPSVGWAAEAAPLLITDGDPEITPSERNIVFWVMSDSDACGNIMAHYTVEKKTGIFPWDWQTIQTVTVFTPAELDAYFISCQYIFVDVLMKEPLILTEPGTYRLGGQTFEVVADTRAPVIEVVKAAPIRSTNIEAVFSEDMAASSFTAGTVTVVGSISGNHVGTFTFNSETDTLLFDPAVDFQYGEIVAVVFKTGVTDMAGNGLAFNRQYTFAIQSAPPALPTSLSLSASASPSGAVPPFSVMTVSGNVLYNTGGAVPVGTVQINTGDNIYTAALNNGSFSRAIVAPATSRNINLSVTDNQYGLAQNTSLFINVMPDAGAQGYNLTTAVVYDYQDQGNGYVNYSQKPAFRTTDRYVNLMAVFNNLNIAAPLDLTWQFFYPNGNPYGSPLTKLDAVLPSWQWGWQTWGFNIRNNSMASNPGRYKIQFLVDGVRKATHNYVVGWDFTEHRMGVDIANPTGEATLVGPTNVFKQTDTRVLGWHNFDFVAQQVDVKYEFVEPNGSIYATIVDTLDDPGSSNTWWDWYRAWGWIWIQGHAAAQKTGTWHLDFFVKNPVSGNWALQYIDYFLILEDPNVAPSAGIELGQPIALANQPLSLTVNAIDNAYLQNVTFYWDDGNLHSQAWNNLYINSYQATLHLGPYPAGTQLTYWAIAEDASGNGIETPHYQTDVRTVEVTEPIAPSGQTHLKPNQPARFFAGGATSSLQDPVEYQFDWGDGQTSVWGIAPTSHAWATTGLYSVRARARSTLASTVVSDWGAALLVTVDGVAPVVQIVTNGGSSFTLTDPTVLLTGTVSDTNPSAGLATVIATPVTANDGTLTNWQFNIALLPGVNPITVTATDHSGNQGTATLTITLDMTSGLLAPVNLTAATFGADSIQLSWSDQSDESEFRLELQSASTGQWAEAAVLSADQTSHIYGGLACNTLYTFRLRGYRSGDGRYSPYTIAAPTLTGSCAQTQAPSALTVTVGGSSSLNLSWSDNSLSEAYFTIERSPDGANGWGEVGTVAANTEIFQDTSLWCGTTYHYRVRAYLSAEDTYSAYSLPANATTAACATPPLYVSPSGDDLNTCRSPAAPCRTIQSAIERAVVGDHIFIDSGTYSETVNLVGKTDLLLAGRARTTTLLQGAPGTYNVNIQSSTNITLRELTLTGGAGVNIDSATATLASSLVHHCVTAQYQGVIHLAGNNQHAHAEIRDNRFYDNQHYYGIVTLAYNADAVVQNNLMARNVILNRANELGIVDFAWGYNMGPVFADVTNNVIVSNTASAVTRPIRELSPHSRLVNNIIADNTGHAIYSNQDQNRDWQNLDSNLYNDFNLLFTNLSGAYYKNKPGPFDVSADPLFVNPAALDFHLKSASPARDAGHPKITDLDGTRSDMGIYGGIELAPGDISPPAVYSFDPLPGATSVSPQHPFSLWLWDDLSGIGPQSLVMMVEGQPITPTLTGTPYNLRLTYTPTVPLTYGQIVDIRLYAQDSATPPNAMPVVSYTVTIDAVANQPPFVPDQPVPSDGSTSHYRNGNLYWGDGEPYPADPDPGDVVTYDIYLEAGNSDPQTVVWSGATSHMRYYANLTTDTQYYWRVVARDQDGLETSGPVWSFHTEPDPLSRPSSGYTLLNTYPSPGPAPTGLTWDGANFWSTDISTQKIYKHNNDAAFSIAAVYTPPTPLGGLAPSDLAWDGTHLWVSNLGYGGRVLRLDANMNSIAENYAYAIEAVSWAQSRLILGSSWEGHLYYEATGNRTEIYSFGWQENIYGLAFDGTYLWVAIDNKLYQGAFDPSDPTHPDITPINVFPLDFTIGAVAWDGQDLVVADQTNASFKRIKLPQLATAQFSANPVTGLTPFTVTFANQSLGAISTCNWAFGDGASGMGCGSISHTYESPGAYLPNLSVLGLGGTHTTSLAEPVRAYIQYLTPTVNAVQPNQGNNTQPHLISIQGSGFQAGALVHLVRSATTYTLTPLSLTPNVIQVMVPARIAPGVYDAVVVNPGGQQGALAVAYYTSALDVEDLFGFDFEITSDPAAVRLSHQPVQLGFTVHRLGGTQVLTDVVVRFYLGDPTDGGVWLGDGLVPFLNPNSYQSATAISWLPTDLGANSIYVLIDPENQVAESSEANNRLHQTLLVQQNTIDITPPTITHLMINNGGHSTDQVETQIQPVAIDPPPPATPSGVESIYLVEYEWNENTHVWIPVQTSGWQPYVGASTPLSWTLTASPGAHYLQVWAMDVAGNISTEGVGEVVNYNPSDIPLPAQISNYYLYHFTAGQAVDVRLLSSSGDADLYVWGPNDQLIGYSCLATSFDQVTFTAPISGVYIVQVYGYTTSTYTHSILTSGLAPELWVMVQTPLLNGKTPLQDPGLMSTLLPEHLAYAVPGVQKATDYWLYLPLIRRGP